MEKVWYAPFKKQAYGQEEIDAVVACLQDGWLAPGPKTAEFEELVCKKFGKKYGLFVNSGSSANMLAFLCAGIGPGVEVVTPACTFSTTIAPLVQHRCKVVFCDVEPDCYVPSVAQVIEKISPSTKIIIIPNLLGNKIDWHDLRQKITEMGRSDIVLIEDSCDTMTHTPDTDIATCSFYASHIMTCGGTGGIAMFNDVKQYNRAKQFRDWGRAGNDSEGLEERFGHGLIDGIPYDFKFLYCEFGYNFKACEMNAAFGLVQFKKLPQFEKLRNDLLHRYIANLQADPVAAKYYRFPKFTEGILFLAFPLACPDRMEILHHLESNQVQTRVTMAGNILRHPVYRDQFPDQNPSSFPVSDQVMKEGFLVGCHHGMTFDDVDYVCKLLIDFAHQHTK